MEESEGDEKTQRKRQRERQRQVDAKKGEITRSVRGKEEREAKVKDTKSNCIRGLKS